jgi:predicted transcriptional regulator
MNLGRSYRDRICIITDVLEVVKVEGGSTNTRIMYSTNPSHDQIKYYPRILTYDNFLYYDLNAPKSKTIEKGLRVIEAYKRIEEMVKSELLESSQSTILQQQVQSQKEVVPEIS